MTPRQEWRESWGRVRGFRLTRAMHWMDVQALAALHQRDFPIAWPTPGHHLRARLRGYKAKKGLRT